MGMAVASLRRGLRPGTSALWWPVAAPATCEEFWSIARARKHELIFNMPSGFNLSYRLRVPKEIVCDRLEPFDPCRGHSGTRL